MLVALEYGGVGRHEPVAERTPLWPGAIDREPTIGGGRNAEHHLGSVPSSRACSRNKRSPPRATPDTPTDRAGSGACFWRIARIHARAAATFCFGNLRLARPGRSSM